MSMSITQLHDGMAVVTFSLPAGAQEGSVSVVGSFNDWTPGAHEMHHVEDHLSMVIEVPLGERVHFRYLGEGGRWFDDPDVEQDQDGGYFVAAAPEAEIALPDRTLDLSEPGGAAQPVASGRRRGGSKRARPAGP
jgi:1,4-alpha-glucan branching enzyme